MDRGCRVLPESFIGAAGLRGLDRAAASMAVGEVEAAIAAGCVWWRQVVRPRLAGRCVRKKVEVEDEQCLIYFQPLDEDLMAFD